MVKYFHQQPPKMNTNQHEFTYDGKTYIAIKLNGTCDHCAFLHNDCDRLKKLGKIPSCIKKVDKGVNFLIFVEKGV